jgi:hypothetical protein
MLRQVKFCVCSLRVLFYSEKKVLKNNVYFKHFQKKIEFKLHFKSGKYNIFTEAFGSEI